MGPEDHQRGSGPLVLEYSDLECPYCAQTSRLLDELEIRRAFRHFPVVSKHPRARVLAAAAEAAAMQGRFWEMHDSLLADQGHLDDPHLWRRCEDLGLDLERFERDRRSPEVGERVQRHFLTGVRAGVVSTPTLFLEGRSYAGIPGAELLGKLGGRPGARNPPAQR